MLELLGWVGAVCFALCAIPQAWECWKTKSADGLASGLVILWVVGEVATLAYVLLQPGISLVAKAPLVFNYAFNLAGLVVIIYYKWFYRGSE